MMTHDDLLDAIQRAKLASAREDKERIRKQLQDDVNKFLGQGGKIQEVTPDDCKGIPCRF